MRHSLKYLVGPILNTELDVKMRQNKGKEKFRTKQRNEDYEKHMFYFKKKKKVTLDISIKFCFNSPEKTLRN